MFLSIALTCQWENQGTEKWSNLSLTVRGGIRTYQMLHTKQNNSGDSLLSNLCTRRSILLGHHGREKSNRLYAPAPDVPALLRLTPHWLGPSHMTSINYTRNPEMQQARGGGRVESLFSSSNPFCYGERHSKWYKDTHLGRGGPVSIFTVLFCFAF